MSTDLREHTATGAARKAGESHGSRTILVLRVAALIEGLALTTIVGLTGSLAWQAVRVLLVVGLTALAVWASVRSSARSAEPSHCCSGSTERWWA